MSDEKNISQENSREQTPNSNEENAKEKTSQHFPEDIRAPKQPQSRIRFGTNTESQIEKMEVHHHGHVHHQKKWKEYFFQFLMLFLAVFCGFLAENQREHYVEHQREKKYAAQLYKELKFDTLAFGDMSRAMQEQLKHYDSVSLLFRQQASFTDDEFVRIARNLLDFYTPFNISTTFQQMKSSGSLRYIRNTELSGALSDYYDTHVPNLLTFFEYLGEKVHTQIEPFFAKHFDLNVTEFYFVLKPDKLSLPPNLRYYDRTENSDLLIKNYYKLYYTGVHFTCHVALKAVKEMAVELIEALKKEYHLK